VNEEKPALSDNANSLKFSASETDNENIARLLNFKKSSSGGHYGNNSLPGGRHTAKPPNQASLTTNDDEEEEDLLRDYTPEDVAQYIFRTKDQQGVANTVARFLHDGKVSSKSRHTI